MNHNNIKLPLDYRSKNKDPTFLKLDEIRLKQLLILGYQNNAHAFVRHIVWFVEKYGDLAVWSCHGMEYSHYTTKLAYQ